MCDAALPTALFPARHDLPFVCEKLGASWEEGAQVEFTPSMLASRLDTRFTTKPCTIRFSWKVSHGGGSARVLHWVGRTIDFCVQLQSVTASVGWQQQDEYMP